MKRLFLVVLVVFAAFFLVLKFFVKQTVPVAPAVSNLASPTPTPTPTPIIETFHYDHFTDLKAELDKVNPQVLDSDFR